MTNEDREPASKNRDMGTGGGGGRGGERVNAGDRNVKDAANNAGNADKQIEKEREMQSKMNQNKPPA